MSLWCRERLFRPNRWAAISIKEGAKLVETADDVLAEYGENSSAVPALAPKRPRTRLKARFRREKAVRGPFHYPHTRGRFGAGDRIFR